MILAMTSSTYKQAGARTHAERQAPVTAHRVLYTLRYACCQRHPLPSKQEAGDVNEGSGKVGWSGVAEDLPDRPASALAACQVVVLGSPFSGTRRSDICMHPLSTLNILPQLVSEGAVQCVRRCNLRALN